MLPALLHMADDRHAACRKDVRPLANLPPFDSSGKLSCLAWSFCLWHVGITERARGPGVPSVHSRRRWVWLEPVMPRVERPTVSPRLLLTLVTLAVFTDMFMYDMVVPFLPEHVRQ